MSTEQDFLVYAPSGGNVQSQAAYAANPNLSNGVGNGIADPTLANKTWRQTSIIAAMIADYIVQQTAQPAIDDGTTATLLENFSVAVANAGAGTITEVTDTGTANAMVITLSPVPASLGALTGRIFAITKSASGNTGAVTINPNTLGNTTLTRSDGSALPSGWWPAAAVGLVICTGTGFVLLSVPSPALLALLASPTLQGVPTAPTAAVGTNTTQLSTTAFVQAALPQAWSNVTGSRSIGTTYTNSTGKPIAVSVWGIASGEVNLVGSVNGVQVACNSVVQNSGNTAGIYFQVPAGATYAVNPLTNSCSLSEWMELV